MLAPLRTLISRFSKIPCSIDEYFPLLFFSASGDLFSSVFLRQVSAANCLCLLAFLDVGSPFCLYQTGGMRHFGQGGRGGRGEHGFWISGLRVGKRAFWYGHGMAFFSFLVIRLGGNEDEKKRKGQNSFFRCIRKRARISMGRKRYNENSHGKNPFWMKEHSNISCNIGGEIYIYNLFTSRRESLLKTFAEKLTKPHGCEKLGPKLLQLLW